MIQLLARPDYKRMILKKCSGGDSEISNYEYKQDSGNTSEEEFMLDSAHEFAGYIPVDDGQGCPESQ